MSSSPGKDDDGDGKESGHLPIANPLTKQTSITSFFKRRDNKVDEPMDESSCTFSKIDNKTSDLVSNSFHCEPSTSNAIQCEFVQENTKTFTIANQKSPVSKTCVIDKKTLQILCFFDVMKTQDKEYFVCKLKHPLRGSGGVFKAENKETVISSLKYHILSTHQINLSLCSGSNFYCHNNETTIKFDSIPQQTLEVFQRLKNFKVEKDTVNLQRTSKQKKSTENEHLPIEIPTTFERTHAPLPVAPTTIAELTIISMLHHSFIDFAHFEEKLNEQLAEANHIRKELCRLKWEGGYDQKKLLETSHSNYSFFSQLSSNSIYGLADTIAYDGYTNKFETRKEHHIKDTRGILNDKPSKSAPQPVHQYLADCKLENKPAYIEPVRDNLNIISGLFAEYSFIAFIADSPINTNEKHGTTIEFKEELKQVKKLNGESVSREDIIKCGCAEFVRFYNANKFDFRSMIPIFEQVYQADLKTSLIDKNIILTASEKAVGLEIPKFLLTDDDLSLKSSAVYDYTIHLFVSLFTTRANVMKWYLMREGSYDRLKTLPPLDRCEFFDCINSVLADRPNNFSDCVKWALNLFNRIFIANVIEANKALRQMGRTDQRYPLSNFKDVNSHKFILSSALLLAEMYNLKDNEGKSPTQRDMQQIIKNTSHSFSTSSQNKNFKKLEKFIEMMHLEHSMSKDGVLLKHPDDLKDMVINPIAPFVDDLNVKQFIDSTIRLRFFNFNNHGNYEKNNSAHLVHRYDKFKFPYFRWSHIFVNLI